MGWGLARPLQHHFHLSVSVSAAILTLSMVRTVVVASLDVSPGLVWTPLGSNHRSSWRWIWMCWSFCFWIKDRTVDLILYLSMSSVSSPTTSVLLQFLQRLKILLDPGSLHKLFPLSYPCPATSAADLGPNISSSENSFLTPQTSQVALSTDPCISLQGPYHSNYL